MVSTPFGPIAGPMKGSGSEEIEPAEGGGVGELRREFCGLLLPVGVMTVMMLETLVRFSVSWRERLRMTSDFIERGRRVPCSFKLCADIKVLNGRRANDRSGFV